MPLFFIVKIDCEKINFLQTYAQPYIIKNGNDTEIDSKKNL